MKFYSEDKDKYLASLQPGDFRDLLWVPVIGSLFFYLEFDKNLDPVLHSRLVPFTLGLISLLSSNGLTILFNTRWIGSWRGAGTARTPRQLKIVGLIIIALCGVSLLFR